MVQEKRHHHDDAAHPSEVHHRAAQSLNHTACQATVHCLTGCAIGEVLGMVIGTALGWGDLATIVLAVVLAFFFGYAFTLIPLVRADIAWDTALGLAFASDTASITIMEIVDNAIMLIIPGAMDAGLTSVLFWESLIADDGCVAFTDGASTLMPNVSWRSPGFDQSDRHPVVCVGWPDAKAYVAWLSKTTGKTYRLLSESEREYVTRAGTVTPFWWGSAITTKQANYDGSGRPFGGRRATVPVDAFTANPWGLYNVHGNAADWTEDCWNESNAGNPGNGTARTTGDCRSRVARGGSFVNPPGSLRSASRGPFVSGSPLSGSIFDIGFRVARTLD